MYSPVVHRYFGGKYCFYFQDQKISQASNKKKTSRTGYLLGLAFDYEDGGGGSILTRNNSKLLSNTIFWHVTPYSTVVYGRFGAYRLHFQGGIVNQVSNEQSASIAGYLAYSSTLKMEAIHFSETSVNLYEITQCHGCGNLTSSMVN
jgi:hypothetical protein